VIDSLSEKIQPYYTTQNFVFREILKEREIEREKPREYSQRKRERGEREKKK
jgi:hypothetical protein